jgi:hypothetical protein
MVISSQRASFLTANTGLLLPLFPLLLPPLMALPSWPVAAPGPDVNPSTDQTVQQHSVNIAPNHNTPMAMAQSLLAGIISRKMNDPKQTNQQNRTIIESVRFFSSSHGIHLALH